jgi:hypothetical protein
MPSDTGAVRRWLDDIHDHIGLAQKFAEGMSIIMSSGGGWADDAVGPRGEADAGGARCVEWVRVCCLPFAPGLFLKPDSSGHGQADRGTTSESQLSATVSEGICERVQVVASNGGNRCANKPVREGRGTALFARRHGRATGFSATVRGRKIDGRSFAASFSVPFWHILKRDP